MPISQAAFIHVCLCMFRGRFSGVASIPKKMQAFLNYLSYLKWVLMKSTSRENMGMCMLLMMEKAKALSSFLVQRREGGKNSAGNDTKHT